ncbi:Smr domain-containing protein [Caenorhabditis elegans]|uniref:Smr domain-containing protein n=1 Tax=Caenorhabditis elegans TaxID=6239 RepID=Q9XU37_CAEEL|nr:Smr domain-containing protein [Caenorhabditis elegans]CAB07185.1 Smr domain-containing protein [Caenorhabditis elegans]|eukprot:NP_507217.1 Uncharacterized protein CELE_F14F8.9 [Caenorhabditis elegans]
MFCREFYELKRDFYIDGVLYGITNDWVDLTAMLNAEDLRATRKRLIEDRCDRYLIETFHNMRNRFKSEKNWRLTKSCENYINFQVRKRNEHIDRMDFLEPQMLIFDLHWFTLGGALDFVREIEKALKNCKNKLIEHDEVVTLIIGKGNHSRHQVPVIYNKLIEIYSDRISVDVKNTGRVFLHFKKKITYSDGLQGVL